MTPPPTPAACSCHADADDVRELLAGTGLEGSPLYAEYVRLLLAAEDAAELEWAATVFGDIDARERAVHDREGAVIRLEAWRRRVAADLFLMLRFAREVMPERFAEVVGPVTCRPSAAKSRAL